jgi:hypothetical protein
MPFVEGDTREKKTEKGSRDFSGKLSKQSFQMRAG